MAAILKNVTNSIWHAFAALQQFNGSVPKSKLKVLTANIGTLLDLYGVERGLDHYRSTQDLDFEHFKYYLQREVFSQLQESMTMSEQRNYEAKVDEVCWLICRKNYLTREKPVFCDSSVYQLFRIFCLLGDLVPDAENPNNFKVLIDSSEAGLVAEQLVNYLGLTWDIAQWEGVSEAMGSLRLATFIAILETKYCGSGDMDEAAIVEAVEEIHQTFIKDIIKKGFLLKKGYLLPTLREYWFVLQPCELSYYKSPSEKLLCGTIALTSHCLIDSVSGTAKPQRFVLTTPERSFELATQDHKSRLQWLSALQLGIEHSSGRLGYQRGQKCKRCKEKQRQKSNAKEAKRTKQLLEEEVKARIAAEEQAQELAVMAQKDNKRLIELQNAQVELEKLLAEETQAKRDEEIVRALQARVLTEEWEKREELERLQDEQKQMLATETLKRKQFEDIQKVKEIQLKEAVDRLKELELEKVKLDKELKLARNKVRLSEDSQQLLEEQLMDIYPANREGGDKIRRAFSFMPTTATSKAVPLLQARAATLKRQSKKKPTENKTESPPSNV